MTCYTRACARVLVAVLALTLPSSALAEEVVVPPPRSAPATYVYADALLRDAVGIGLTYWFRRGLPGCFPSVWVMDDRENPERATTEEFGCAIWFDRGFRDEVWVDYSDRHQLVGIRRRALVRLCAAAIHGEGHNRGLGHSLDPRSIMYEREDGRSIPQACTRWARGKVSSTHRRTYRLPRGES